LVIIIYNYILIFPIKKIILFYNNIKQMSQEIKQKEQERAQQNQEIMSSEPAAMPVPLEKISESEVKPEDSIPVTTSLAQNLGVSDPNPLPTTPSQQQPEDLSQSQHKDHEHKDHQHKTHAHKYHQQQHRDTQIYGANGVLREE
jgi:ABC-type nickel/cobalt efflux system permease component RcnA